VNYPFKGWTTAVVLAALRFFSKKKVAFKVKTCRPNCKSGREATMPARTETKGHGRDFKGLKDSTKSKDSKKPSDITPGPRRQKQTIVIAPKLVRAI